MQERRVAGRSDEEQPLGDPAQPVQLADHDLDVLALLLAGEIAGEQLGVAERDRDRRPQLVRGVLEEPPLVGEQPGVVLAEHRVARSAASLRWACHAMATNTAAISGTSVSSAGAR